MRLCLSVYELDTCNINVYKGINLLIIEDCPVESPSVSLITWLATLMCSAFLDWIKMADCYDATTMKEPDSASWVCLLRRLKRCMRHTIL